MDEELDRQALAGMQAKSVDQLMILPREKLNLLGGGVNAGLDTGVSPILSPLMGEGYSLPRT